MKLEKIGSKLKGEALRSPAKAGVLALLSVVAVIFWAPLVWKWVRGAEKSAVVDNSAEIAAGAAAASVDLPQAATEPSREGPSISQAFDWRSLASAIDNDPRTRPQLPTPVVQNPFRFVRQISSEDDLEEAEQENPDEVKPPFVFASLGLTLTSTIVGPAVRAAHINGETYRLGERVVVSASPGREDSGYEFVLKEIQSNVVRLVREGNEYQLELKQPGRLARGKIMMRGDRIVVREQ